MKGLSFSEPMVKAWMEGRKTVTRRLMNPQPIPEITEILFAHNNLWLGYIKQKYGQESEHRAKYLPGETVYIKETWMGTPDCLSYKASDPRQIIEFNHDRWKSPRFMPAWAARSHARIVSVRPERIQEITEEEAKREGVTPFRNDPEGDYWTDGTYRKAFEYLWNEIYGWCPNSFESNPWVWRIELEKVKEVEG